MGCHGSCDRYMAFFRQEEAVREERNAQVRDYADMIEYQKGILKDWKKKHQR